MTAFQGEEGYLALADDILTNGRIVADRTGVGTRSVFGRQLRFDLTKYFPLLTTKRVYRPALVHELLWFLSGDTNIAYLKANNVGIWDEWADANGDLGPVYGKQWRSWANPKIATVNVDREGWGSFDEEQIVSNDPIDQISNVMHSLRDNPHGRRHVVSAWNPADVDDMALPPCHCLFQFHVRALTLGERLDVLITREGHSGFGLNPEDPDGAEEFFDAEGVPKYFLDCQLYQRSADLFLGVPFNIASYALLTHMMAQQLGYVAGEFVHTFGDVHIYRNHEAQVREQLSREILAHPTLHLTKAASLFDYKYDDIKFEGYRPHKPIPAPVAK